MRIFADAMIKFPASVDSEQKFKNLAALMRIFLNKIHFTEDFIFGLMAIDIGNRIYTETMDEKETPRVFLRLHMAGHPVWNHTIIWEKALFKSIWDELWNNSPVRGMTKEHIEWYE